MQSSRVNSPLAVPDLKEVKSFAGHLHSLSKYWQGELFGWQAEYTAESDRKPEDSKMTFTPADFYRLLRKSLNLLEEITSKNQNFLRLRMWTCVRHSVDWRKWDLVLLANVGAWRGQRPC